MKKTLMNKLIDKIGPAAKILSEQFSKDHYFPKILEVGLCNYETRDKICTTIKYQG